MTYSLPIILLLLGFTLPLTAQQSSQVSPPAVRPNGNTLDVRFGGKVRLAAGGPLFQSGTPEKAQTIPDEVITKANVKVFLGGGTKT
jgi:hypothetical protein